MTGLSKTQLSSCTDVQRLMLSHALGITTM